MDTLARRQFLRIGLASSAVIALAGCETTQTAGGGLPGPLWPKDPHIAPPRTSGPAPVPQPSNGLPANVIARTNWTRATPIVSRADPMGKVTKITVHHEGSTPFYATAKPDVARRLDSIRNAHVSQGWADIGYHYVIDPAGRVWQGRPMNLQGAHVKDGNPGNLGVMVMGNFETQRPTAAQLATLDQFVASQMRRYSIAIRSVYTHRELRPTACPGRSLQAYMLQTRSSKGRMARA